VIIAVCSKASLLQLVVTVAFAVEFLAHILKVLSSLLIIKVEGIYILWAIVLLVFAGSALVREV
jgi:hypothetical protein